MLKFLLSTALALSALMSYAQDKADGPRITNGPVVESLTSTTGVVAWSTNVSSGSVVTYGVAPDHLTQRSEMPWGGYTHRVTLHQLQPDTTYFFQASSPDAKGSGEMLRSEVEQFHTPLSDGVAASNPKPGK
jgi:hypothetical protein